MNLPAAAPEFMDAFKHAFDPSIWPPRQLPLVRATPVSRSLSDGRESRLSCDTACEYVPADPQVQGDRVHGWARCGIPNMRARRTPDTLTWL